MAEEFRERNRTALLNLLSDSTIALTGFILLLRNSDGRGALFGTIGRVFSGFSDTAKAFLIIACKRLGLCSSQSHHSPAPLILLQTRGVRFALWPAHCSEMDKQGMESGRALQLG